MHHERPLSDKPDNLLFTIKEGLHYIYSHSILFVTLLIMAVVGTFAPNFNVLVPVFATQILHQQETGFGFLMSFMGLGSFFGAMFIATLSRSGPKKMILYIVPLAVGLLLVLDGFSGGYIWMCATLAVTGFFFVMFSSNANSTMQLNSDDMYRGRVMSIYSLIFAGSTPIGNLYAGSIADRLNARTGFIACGAIILILMVPIYLFLWHKGRKQADLEQQWRI